MKIPKFVIEHFRYHDNFEAIKEDLRAKLPLDDVWYWNVVYAVDELSELETLGLSRKNFFNLASDFDNWTDNEKEQVCIDKYDGQMTVKDKAIEALLDYYNAIYMRFVKKAKLE